LIEDREISAHFRPKCRVSKYPFVFSREFKYRALLGPKRSTVASYIASYFLISSLRAHVIEHAQYKLEGDIIAMIDGDNPEVKTNLWIKKNIASSSPIGTPSTLKQTARKIITVGYHIHRMFAIKISGKHAIVHECMQIFLS